MTLIYFHDVFVGKIESVFIYLAWYFFMENGGIF